MKKEELLIEIIKRLDRNEFQYQIKSFLASEGITEKSAQEDILASAAEIIKAEKKQKLPLLNKILFSGSLFCAIAVFIGFTAYLPYQFNIYDFPFLYAVLGVICFIMFATLTIRYYKSWTPVRVEKQLEGIHSPDIMVNFIFWLIPGIILTFSLYMYYSHTEREVLAATKIHTTGTIISGVSKTTRRSTSAVVTVRYTTKAGKIFQVNEEVYITEFRNLYIGKEVNMVYSSKYPTIIELLYREEDIKRYTNSVERQITPNDLMEILDKKMLPSVETLNRITFGWKKEAEGIWVNESKDMYLMVNDNEVVYATNMIVSHLFGDKLIETGFIRLPSSIADRVMGGFGLYEKEGFNVEIKREHYKREVHAVITIQKEF